MSDPHAGSPDPGYVPFRAATAIAGARQDGKGEAERPLPPPLPPPPPGVEPRSGAAPAAGPARPPPPPAPVAGASRADAWASIVDWCARARVARGGLLARRDGTVVETHGAPPVDDVALLARRLCAALAAAREAGGREPAAAALDLGTAWVTVFAVEGPAGSELVAGLWGSAPLRGAIRAPVARWVGEALAAGG